MKRNLISKSYLALALASVLGFSSCLKDSRYNDFTKGVPLVEIPLAANAGVLQSASFDIVSTPTPFKIAVNVASVKPLTSDLTVTLAVDQAALDAYNTANSTTYTLLPTAAYTLPSTKVTVPANQRLGYLTVNLNTSAIDPAANYALPITITDGGGQQISNYKTIITTISVKNKFDGRYTVNGTMVDVTSASLTGNYPRTVDLITTGANTVAYFDVSLANFTHAILSSGSISQYGTFAPIFTIDANNKVTTVVNYYGQPAANTRSAHIDATGVNALTGTPGAAGSVIQVKYIMNQTNSVGDRVFFNETFTYKGARP